VQFVSFLYETDCAIWVGKPRFYGDIECALNQSCYQPAISPEIGDGTYYPRAYFPLYQLFAVYNDTTLARDTNPAIRFIQISSSIAIPDIYAPQLSGRLIRA